MKRASFAFAWTVWAALAAGGSGQSVPQPAVLSGQAHGVVTADGSPVYGGAAFGNAAYGRAVYTNGGYGGGVYDPGFGGGCCGGACGQGYGANCGPHGMGPFLWDQVHEPARSWVALDYVGLRVEGMQVPALVTSSPAGTAQAAAGVLPNAQTLYGNDRVNDGWRDGAEVRLGWWLIDGQFIGLEGHYLLMQSERSRFAIASVFTNGAGGTIIARPFVNANGGNSARVISFPNFQAGPFTYDLNGSIAVDINSEMQSAGATFKHILWADFERNFRLDLIGGYRFFRLDDTVSISDSVLTPPLGPDPAVVEESFDVFDSENEIHGGDLGLSLEVYRGRWSAELVGKCALGNNRQSVSIDGTTVRSSGGAVAILDGGLLATASNSGSFVRDKLAVIPEARAKIRFDLADNVRLSAGYRIFYINEVARAGDQINLAPGSAFQWVSTSMWAQGMDAGVEITW